MNSQINYTTLGNGCFWCTEAIFKQLQGVIFVQSGYSGGTIENPSYDLVCTGTTGHAEVLRIQYDENVITFSELLEVFFATHDPTTLNRQGNDVGTQYRSVIFYHNDQQKETALKYIAQLEAEKTFHAPIVTAVEPLTNFYPAENYHEDYVRLHPENTYCQMVVIPKIEKFRKKFNHKLSPGS